MSKDSENCLSQFLRAQSDFLKLLLLSSEQSQTQILLNTIIINGKPISKFKKVELGYVDILEKLLKIYR